MRNWRYLDGRRNKQVYFMRIYFAIIELSVNPSVDVL